MSVNQAIIASDAVFFKLTLGSKLFKYVRLKINGFSFKQNKNAVYKVAANVPGLSVLTDVDHYSWHCLFTCQWWQIDVRDQWRICYHMFNYLCFRRVCTQCTHFCPDVRGGTNVYAANHVNINSFFLLYVNGYHIDISFQFILIHFYSTHGYAATAIKFITQMSIPVSPHNINMSQFGYTACSIRSLISPMGTLQLLWKFNISLESRAHLPGVTQLSFVECRASIH